MNVLWGGFLLGLAASAHCALMCGPFASLAAPRGARAVIHHGSRIAAYAVLGAVTGFLGSAFVSAGGGRVLAIAAALTLVVHAFVRLPASSALASKTTGILAAALDRLRRVRDSHSFLAAVGVGVVNGLLPCGMVYAALIASAGIGGPLESASFMTAFGAGTVPALGLVAGLVQSAVRRVPALGKLAPAALVLVAILIAVRGWPMTPPIHSH